MILTPQDTHGNHMTHLRLHTHTHTHILPTGHSQSGKHKQLGIQVTAIKTEPLRRFPTLEYLTDPSEGRTALREDWIWVPLVCAACEDHLRALGVLYLLDCQGNWLSTPPLKGVSLLKTAHTHAHWTHTGTERESAARLERARWV